MDDVAGLTRGPGPTLLLYLALLVATHLAGLVVEDHRCVELRGPRGQEAAELLRCFPSPCRALADGGVLLAYGPVEVFGRLLVATGAWTWGELQLTRRLCRCKTKHGLIPAAQHGLWALSLAGTPLAAALADHARFLGAQLVSCSAGQDPVALRISAQGPVQR